MRPVRTVLRWCGKGLRAYWAWMVKASETMGDPYGPW
ncbi:hypothetical protein SAMN05421543_10427 [Alicyclobacillus macrosporangiidus]|uniref:Uncharacterized protein n=1 Tax=Alicyclobacillus macrosporangiidus TaxID=392015 RepID=A0A1I7H7Q7_9BACL|nr:hypothetical protein SAMN05421543_10427 [Alicyclobacillus macrosporangiidus]